MLSYTPRSLLPLGPIVPKGVGTTLKKPFNKGFLGLC
jgi:hypothetical protein